MIPLRKASLPGAPGSIVHAPSIRGAGPALTWVNARIGRAKESHTLRV
jgi:hypothetical protein